MVQFFCSSPVHGCCRCESKRRLFSKAEPSPSTSLCNQSKQNKVSRVLEQLSQVWLLWEGWQWRINGGRPTLWTVSRDDVLVFMLLNCRNGHLSSKASLDSEMNLTIIVVIKRWWIYLISTRALEGWLSTPEVLKFRGWYSIPWHCGEGNDFQHTNHPLFSIANSQTVVLFGLFGISQNQIHSLSYWRRRRQIYAVSKIVLPNTCFSIHRVITCF